MHLGSPNKIQSPLLDSSGNVESLRAERIWRLLYVQLGTWLFFCLFFLVRGFSTPSLICIVEAVMMLAIINPVLGGRRRSCSTLMNMSLAASGIGLFLVSLSDPALHQTMFFYPVAILIASQLLGVRAAFGWLVVNLVAHTAFLAAAYGFTEVFMNRMDQLTVTCGSSVCIFFCCQQGEAFFKERMRDLASFSNGLSKKSAYLQKLATTDSLTGLLNRHQFHVELDAAIVASKSSQQRLTLLVIDMDGFKEINDTLGHPVGDKALVEIGNRLNSYFSGFGIVSRLGGDEFCVILQTKGGDDDAGRIASEVCDLLKQQFSIEKHDFSLSSSIGIAHCPDDAQTAIDLFSYADTAMYHAKRDQLGYASYAACMTEELVEYRTMQEQLSCALEQEEFFLVYQPQICLQTGKVFGAEALLRWQHNGELISPMDFIPMLEKSRDIINVGQWVIRECCRQMQQWQQMGIDITLSINISAIQFLDDEFNAKIERSLNEFQIDGRKLDFEITESLLVEDVVQAIAKLTRIKEMGSSISIDDFGTGFSSLAYLRQFPLDRLKIDRTFVKDIPEADDGVIASSIVALGKAVGLKVLAEGVETDDQLKYLKSLDCDEYQGYLFSRPLAAPDFEELMVDENVGQPSAAQIQVARIPFGLGHTNSLLTD